MIANCAFCRRQYDDDKTYTGIKRRSGHKRRYCTVTCREGIPPIDQDKFSLGGIWVPYNEHPRSELHAVSAMGYMGERESACGLYGRFIPRGRDWKLWSSPALIGCRRCEQLMQSFETVQEEEAA